MIDFANAKEIMFRDNSVKEITDASGRVIWSAVKPLISFTIKESNNSYWGTVTYQAEEGMTWGEWVDSEYNPPYTDQGYSILYEVNGNMIRNNEHGLNVYVPTDYSFPSPSDLIIANFAYQLAKD